MKKYEKKLIAMLVGAVTLALVVGAIIGCTITGLRKDSEASNRECLDYIKVNSTKLTDYEANELACTIKDRYECDGNIVLLKADGDGYYSVIILK